MYGFNISPDTFFAQPSSVLIVLRPLSGVNCYEPACGNYKTESGLPSAESLPACSVLTHVHSHPLAGCSREREGASSCPSLARQFGECLTALAPSP